MAFVGREQELDLLAREVVLALETSSGRSLFVAGPPGAGKTTLVAELLQRLRQARPDVRVAQGRCLQSFGTGDPYLPFVEALGDLSDESRPGSVKKETLSGLVAELAPYWLGVVPVVGSFLSASYSTASALRGTGKSAAPPSREALFVQYLELVRSLAKSAPLILFLDDLHWADQASTALLAHVGRGIGSLPVVLVATLRSDEAELDRHPVMDVIRELEREELARRVELAELTGAPLDALLAAEFGGDVAEPLRHWLTDTAGGNPLFVSELCRLLKQSGAAVEALGEWHLTDAVHSLAVPRSAEAVIETRIQRLDPESIRVLQYASVEGNEFNSGVLARLLERDELELLDELEAIERRYQLIRTAGELALPDGDLATTFAFRHALVQTVLYRQVIGKRRVLLHRKCGEILEELFRDAPDPVAGKLARHFHEGRLSESAHRYARIAADAARLVYAHWEAEELLRIALQHSPGVPETIALEERLGDVYDTVGYYEKGITAYRSALERLPEGSPVELRLHRKIISLERKAALVPAPTLLQRVRARLEESGGNPVERCYLLLETSLLPDAVGTVEAVEEALRIAEGANATTLHLLALERLASVLLFSGRVEEALPHLDRALGIAGPLGDPVRTALYHNIAGIAHAKLGRFRDAKEAFEQMLRIAEQIGDPRKISVACSNMGCLLLRLGANEEAETVLQRAQTIHERRDRAGVVQSLFNLAERARLTGDLELAVRRYERLLESAAEMEYWSSEAVAHAGLGLCHLAAGRIDDAHDCACRVLAVVADRQQWFEDRDLVELFLARLEVRDGELERAEERLEAAAHALQGADVYLWARVEMERAELLGSSHPDRSREIVERVSAATASMQSPPLQEQIARLRKTFAVLVPATPPAS